MKLDYLSDLNPEQREAALCREHCMVIALPGAGKTKTLASKAAFVLSDGQSRVAAVTFTRDAALELRERILHIAGPQVLPRIIVGTYHSVDLLMAFPSRSKPGGMGSNILSGRTTPFKNPWVLIPEGHRRSFIARALNESGMSIEFEDAAKILESAKSDPKIADTPEKKKLLSIYMSLLDRHGSIDFQDIILKTNKALEDGSLAPLAVDMLFLDEYQDTDLQQYTWASAHGRAGVKITAVGDDDQSIYGFRKAMGYAGVQLFKQQFRAQEIILGMNYRSHEEVLASATLLIGKNEHRVQKEASTHKGYGGSIEWEGFASRQLEADACGDAARQAIAKKQTFAVLSRTSGRLDHIEASLIIRQVPFVRSEGESILDHREYVLFASMVESLYKPSPKAVDEAMAWCGLPEEDVAKLHALSGGRIQPLNSSLMIKEGIEPNARSMWNKFTKLHSDWKEASQANYPMSSLMVRLGIQDFLVSNTTDKRSIGRLELIYALFECGDKGTLREKLEKLNSAKMGSKKDTDTNKVQLMTAHGSKGLEFDSVWIVGAEDGVFPHKDGSVDEERRLFYVAMTRARKHLVVSKSGVKPPSAFITEAQMPRAELGKYKTSDKPT